MASLRREQLRHLEGGSFELQPEGWKNLVLEAGARLHTQLMDMQMNKCVVCEEKWTDKLSPSVIVQWSILTRGIDIKSPIHDYTTVVWTHIKIIRDLRIHNRSPFCSYSETYNHKLLCLNCCTVRNRFNHFSPTDGEYVREPIVRNSLVRFTESAIMESVLL